MATTLRRTKTTTVNLPGIGDMPAVPVSDVEAGGVLMAPNGTTLTVEYIAPTGRKGTFILIERDDLTGVTYTRIVPGHRLVAYLDADHAAAQLAARPGNIEDVTAATLDDCHGREISTPDGWRRLANTEIRRVDNEIMVDATLVGRPHQVLLHLDQFVGTRGRRIPTMLCGCLPLEYDTVGHYPPCAHADAAWTPRSTS